MSVNLTNNQLTGQIPWPLVGLNQLYEFTIANNSFSGQIPRYRSRFPPQYFANNQGHCGIPLGSCKETSRKSRNLVIIGSAACGLVFAALIIVVLAFLLFGVSEKKAKDVERFNVEGSEWVKTMQETKGFKVS